MTESSDFCAFFLVYGAQVAAEGKLWYSLFERKWIL